MPTYVAFLRAINLGAKRKFPKDAIKRATEAAGGRDVETYINTGNVRLTHTARSVARVAALLESSYLAETGFEVPTIVFTAAEAAALADAGEELNGEHAPAGQHYVTLFATPPDPAAIEAVHALDFPGERCVVVDRAAHVLLDGGIQANKVMNTREFKALGRGTARTLNVLRTVSQKWC
ncbi:DUF1697 domain-containing protein [Nocardioides seonyuensis]|uniref:DUF1697 domain-containing protein n=1 Tax=Nocardioides seonyuensis TaxID=2518371 RepID=A0A4V1BLX4_9ACTN|nr:DUF1697 domain-containing protein [Nocardioides seonyuensis]QBX54382.1 DUF1697 domain-containing protein [Nocardioides seonyuensis]